MKTLGTNPPGHPSPFPWIDSNHPHSNQNIPIAVNLNTGAALIEATPSSTTAFTEFVNEGVGATPLEVSSVSAKIYGLRLFNPNGATAYAKFYDKRASDIVVGTDSPKYRLPIPAAQSGTPGMIVGTPDGFPLYVFDTAITIVIVDAIETSATGALASSIVMEAELK